MSAENSNTFVIAEAGVNHDGDPAAALALVEIAAAARADAVKFQTFKAERLAGRTAPKAPYQAALTDARESHQAMLRRLELTDDAHTALKAAAEDRDLAFLSTPFDEEAADALDALGVAVFKTPSGELTNAPYLAHVARKGRPMIVSTGGATLSEVERAVRTIEDAGGPPLTLLHCTSAYPAPDEDANLRALETLKRAFGHPVGLSDHTTGTAVALAAVALGAAVVEKHFTSDRTRPGPDHAASLEPDELASMIADIRTVERALGDGVKRPRPSECAVIAAARKSLVAARDLPAGHVLREADLARRRPGDGFPPDAYDRVVGRTLAKPLLADEVVRPEHLA